MNLRTLIVTADWYRVRVRYIDSGYVWFAERKPMVLGSLATRDLDYALAYGRRNWPSITIAALIDDPPAGPETQT